MSMPYLEFTCNRCGVKGDSTVRWGRFSYEGRAGLIDVRRDVGWCSSCGALAPVETLPDRKAVQSLLTSIAEKVTVARDRKSAAMHGRSRRARIFNASKHAREIAALDREVSYQEEALHEANELLFFLEHRESEARCLQCGETDFRPLVFDILPIGFLEQPGPPVPTETLHPGCGGRFQVQHSGDSLMKVLSHRIYDREGRLLREEEDS